MSTNEPAQWTGEYILTKPSRPWATAVYSLFVRVRLTPQFDARESALPIVEIRLNWQSNQ